MEDPKNLSELASRLSIDWEETFDDGQPRRLYWLKMDNDRPLFCSQSLYAVESARGLLKVGFSMGFGVQLNERVKDIHARDKAQFAALVNIITTLSEEED